MATARRPLHETAAAKANVHVIGDLQVGNLMTVIEQAYRTAYRI